MARMKEAAKEAMAKKAAKQGPVAKSLIIWEVKPISDETNLEELANKIL